MADENENNDQNTGGDEGTEDDKSKPKNPHGLTAEQQAEVTRIMAREKREGKDAGRRALLEELGVEDPDELKALLGEAKERREKESSETDRIKSENDKLKKQVEDLKAEGKQRDFNERVQAALVTEGVPLKSAAKVRKMLPDIELTADDDAIKDAVKDLKEEFPDLFAEQASGGEQDDDKEIDPRTGFPRRQRDGAPPAPPSDPGRQPRKPGKTGDLKEQAKSIFAERHPELAKN